MFTMCILFSTITNKAYDMCEGASTQSQDLKNYTALWTGPYVKIPGSATAVYIP